jgi:hypothetical protein
VTEVSELAEFIAARYRKEAAALERIEDRSEPWPGRWIAKAGTLYTYNGWCLAVIHRDHSWNPEVLKHIVRYDPARALANLEAKRRILKRHARCANGEGWCGGRTVGREFCDDMADLAAPYAGHARFKAEWSMG